MACPKISYFSTDALTLVWIILIIINLDSKAKFYLLIVEENTDKNNRCICNDLFFYGM